MDLLSPVLTNANIFLRIKVLLNSKSTIFGSDNAIQLVLHGENVFIGLNIQICFDDLII